MQPLITPYFLAECFAFLCSILLFSKGIKKYLIVFSFYCFAVIVNETISTQLITNWHKETNYVLNNFAILVFFSFYMFTCLQEVESVLKKRFIILIEIIFLLNWLVEINVNTIYQLVDYTLIIGCICTAITALIYMTELLANYQIVNPLKCMFFYVASAYLLYSIPLAIIFALHKYFAVNKTPVEKDFRQVFSIIINIVNVLMYLLLSISFITAWKQRKLSK